MCGKYYRQGEFLHGLAVVYANIYEIDHWWIGLTDLGMFHIYSQVKPFDHLSFIGFYFDIQSVLGKEERWIWAFSGENLTDTFWGPKSPNMDPGNTDDCGLMVVEANNFWWQDSSCLTANVDSKKVAPICQHERIIPATSPMLPLLTTRPLCPNGWREFESHCYFFSGNETRLIWVNAENDCIHRGGHLASIHSLAEQDFVVSISTNRTWLGASDIIAEVCFFSSTSKYKYIFTLLYREKKFLNSFLTK